LQLLDTYASLISAFCVGEIVLLKSEKLSLRNYTNFIYLKLS